MHKESDVRSSRHVIEATQYRFYLKIYLETGADARSARSGSPHSIGLAATVISVFHDSSTGQRCDCVKAGS